jgi:hypothetical protein
MPDEGLVDHARGPARHTVRVFVTLLAWSEHSPDLRMGSERSVLSGSLKCKWRTLKDTGGLPRPEDKRRDCGEEFGFRVGGRGRGFGDGGGHERFDLGPLGSGDIRGVLGRLWKEGNPPARTR